MTRISVSAGILTACAFVLILNIGVFGMRAGDASDIVRIGTSVDELFYFAQIRDAATGYANLGNASLFEHRFDRAISSEAPVLQGMLMRIFHWNILTAVTFGDVLFPFFFALFLYVILLRLLSSIAGAALSVFIVGSAAIGSGLLRSISPQVTLVFFFATIMLFLAHERTALRTFLLGFFIAVLLYVQVLYAAFLLFAEALDLVRALSRREKSIPHILGNRLMAAAPIIVAAACKFFLMPAGGDALAIADTYRRLGLISSHLPANPALQIVVLCTVGALTLARRKKIAENDAIDLLLTLLVAGLLALNQSVLHGIDVVFGLYYALPLRILLWITWIFLAWKWVGVPRVRLAILALVSIAAAHALWISVSMHSSTEQGKRQHLLDAGVPAILESLAFLPHESIVIAPYEIADLVPVFTDHYVAFNRTSRYQSATDKELGERYLLQHAVFPSSEPEDDTYNLVFGLSAGNLAARNRTMCSIVSFFTRSNADCLSSIRDFIFHQDVMRQLDRKQADVRELFLKYGITTLVSNRPLTQFLSTFCTSLSKAGVYTVYRCDTH